MSILHVGTAVYMTVPLPDKIDLGHLQIGQFSSIFNTESIQYFNSIRTTLPSSLNTHYKTQVVQPGTLILSLHDAQHERQSIVQASQQETVGNPLTLLVAKIESNVRLHQCSAIQVCQVHLSKTPHCYFRAS
jgi:hypothetical protein